MTDKEDDEKQHAVSDVNEPFGIMNEMKRKCFDSMHRLNSNWISIIIVLYNSFCHSIRTFFAQHKTLQDDLINGNFLPRTFYLLNFIFSLRKENFNLIFLFSFEHLLPKTKLHFSGFWYSSQQFELLLSSSKFWSLLDDGMINERIAVNLCWNKFWFDAIIRRRHAIVVETFHYFSQRLLTKI